MARKTMSGKYKPLYPAKYKGDFKNITYRSSWELAFMKYCDTCPDVVEWNSEEVVIPYISPVDGRQHRYFMDFYTKLKIDNKVYKYIIEVKPNAQTKPPKQPKRRTKRYLEEVKTFAVNTAKWEAAEKYAKKYGYTFKILDEYGLGFKHKKGTING